MSPLGLKILAFPCNQFMKQEPKSEKEIKEFASQYGVKFQLFKKIEINGPNTHDVYKYLKWNSELRNGNQVR